MGQSDSAERIMVAAEQALMHGDPGSLRIDAIAAAAQVNKRMIYHYFSDRQGLLSAVYDRQLQRMLAARKGVSPGTQQVLKVILQARMGQIDADAADRVEPGPPALQIAARLLLPLLLTESSDVTGAASSQALPRLAWAGFCIELMSLALSKQVPVQWPETPGTAEFVALSARLLSAEKPRRTLVSASRVQSPGTV